MFISSVMLAFSTSIDSLGIGVSYGIKGTKFPLISKFILFIIALLVTTLSVCLGNLIGNFFPSWITKIIGNIILIGLGIFIFFSSLPNKNINTNYDINDDNKIEPKESMILGFTVSLDSFCVGIGASIMGISFLTFPLFTAFFNILFITFGNFLGNKVNKLGNLPTRTWSLISGLLLVLIGILRLFF